MKNKYKLSACAVMLALSNSALAACIGLADGASAVLSSNNILSLVGTNQDENFQLTVANDVLTVTRTVGNVSSCATFNYSAVKHVIARLGDGNDTYGANKVVVNQSVEGGNGNDNITTGSGNDYLIGGLGNDVLNANGGQDRIEGNDGDDSVDGGAGNDMIYGGTGHDYLYGGPNDDLIFGNEGGDLIMGGQGKDTLFGDDGNDYLGGGCTLRNANASIIFKASGCTGADSDDVIHGGNGDDVLSGDEGDDKLYGDNGDDYLTGNGGYEDRLYGGEGRDLLLEVGENNVNSSKWHKAWGQGGDDMLVSEDTNSYLSGGDGNDAVISVSSNFEAEMYGGDNGDYLWSGDALPVGSCGSGDDKGMVFLNDCEGTTWVTDYQGMLTKLISRDNYANPYYEAANRVVNKSGGASGFPNKWRTYGGNVRPYALYDIASKAGFEKWQADQSLPPYNYYEWKVSYDVGSGITGEYTHCMEGNAVWTCRQYITREEMCWDKHGSEIACE